MADKDQNQKREIPAMAAVAVVLAIALVLSLAIPNPRERRYPMRKEVRFWHMWTAEWREVVADICDRFNESQDVYEVMPLSVPPNSASTKFLLAVAGGDPPDCMAQWDPVIPRWADSGLLTPLDVLMGEEEWERFQRESYPIAVKQGSYQDHLYGVTVGINLWAAYYRPSMVEESGLDPDRFPKTLEGLMEWGRKLHRFDEAGQLTRIGFLPNWWQMYVPVFGGGFYDWEKKKLTLENPANLRALQFLDQSRIDLGRDRILYFESALNTTFGADWPFISGAYAVMVDGQWRIEQLKRFAPDLDYDVAPIPPPKGGKPLAGWSNGNFMVVPKGAKNAQGAMEFIKFWSGMNQPERAAEFYTWGGWLPLNSKVAAAPAYREYVKEHPKFQVFLDMLPSPNIQPLPPVPYQVYLADRITRADESVMRGTYSPEEGLDRLVKEIEAEIQRRQERGHDG